MPKKRKKTGLYLKAGLIKSFLNQCRLKLVTLREIASFSYAIKITERSLARILFPSDKLSFIFSSVIRFLKKIKENKLVQLINKKAKKQINVLAFIIIL